MTWKAQSLELLSRQRHPLVKDVAQFNKQKRIVKVPPTQPSYHRKRHVNTQEGDGAAPSTGCSLNRISLKEAI